MSQLALYLFGPPRLELDGVLVHIPRRKALALLAHLSVTGKSHSRDSLATLLWPGNGQGKARAELRRMLSALTQALGSGWLNTDRETVCLNTNNDSSERRTFWLDIIKFQGNLKVGETHNHPPTETCPDCLPALEEAVELYQDDFMAGFSLKDCPAYDEWQFFQGEELRGQLTNALVRLSSHYEKALEYETAISHTRRWLALDPLHEPAHRQLMTLYDQSGQRAVAIRQYQTCRAVMSEELGVEPSEETQALYQRIRASTLISLQDLRPKSNLPVQTTPFVGRESELAEIQARLTDADCRLLTLLGPGGSGKTRLAIEAAGGLVDDFKHGVFFVNLAPLQDGDNIPTTIATALKISFSGEIPPKEQLLDYLRNKEMLLILDNFEHLLEGVNFVNQILRTASKVKILATSRTRLMVTGEHIVEVWGMAYPESPVLLQIASQKYSAIKLFESEASRVKANFELNEENLPDVIEICSLLEGMPLGIVLAANWVTLLTPAEITAEIKRNFEFLEEEMSDLPRRQRGMWSTFNYSWRLLSEGERESMRALSVFRGGFTRDAALAIASAASRDLKRLTDQSMIHCTSTGRYEIHELLRQYAAEKLENDPATEDIVRGKHSDFYCQALTVWERKLQGPKQIEALQEMALEIDNIRAAWDWAVEHLRIKTLQSALNGLVFFLIRNRQYLEGVEICRLLVERLDTMEPFNKSKPNSHDEDRIPKIDRLKLKTRTLALGGRLNHASGKLDLGLELYQKCLSLLENCELAEQDTRFERGIVYLGLPFTMKNAGPGDTKQMAEESVQLFKSINESWLEGFGLAMLGFRAASIFERIKFYEQSYEIVEKLGDLWWMAHSLGNLARDKALLGQFEKAEDLAYEALDTWNKLDDREGIVAAYGILGTALVWEGRFTEARALESKIRVETVDLGYTHSRVAWFHAVASLPDLYLGEYSAARVQAQHSLELLKDVKRYSVAVWNTIAIDVLGRVALAEGSFAEAVGLFQKCFPFDLAQKLPDDINQALAGLGYAFWGLNQITKGKGYFCSALRVATEAKEYLTLAHTLPGIALLFAEQGDGELAVELYALATTCGIVANSKWFDDIAGDEIAKKAEGLPIEVVEAARARGRKLDLWETAEALLVELEELGWGSADQ